MSNLNKSMQKQLKKKLQVDAQQQKAREAFNQSKQEVAKVTQELNEALGEELLKQLGTSDYEAAFKVITNIQPIQSNEYNSEVNADGKA
ncbi:hypothetical protein IV73_GL001063 [Weissella kandleri]|uniref:Uncharacterized protein n=1 Tax=Weissella kandleri TaxID=1616 RepID=A0A0R2JBW7_9LACO|nr:hypothetical protein [Weissella kandleri]KRN74786.1 hypothetical protein IV73_GL001063 [Weissella kandleri]